jgi:hypothetical protein
MTLLWLIVIDTLERNTVVIVPAGTDRFTLRDPRGCYEPVRRMPAACWRKRQANATK